MGRFYRSARFLRVSRVEAHMAIAWKKDVDEAMKEARASGRFLLLDFNAAPM
jgi:hypothetical protein